MPDSAPNSQPPQTLTELKLLRLRELKHLRDEVERQKSERDAAARHAHATRITRYYNDPAGFARDAIDWPEGKSLAPYQAEVLAAIPDKRRVSVRGPHGLGKAQPPRWRCSGSR